MAELITLVDDTGKPIGDAPKLASHHATTPLHLAFSCFIFNQRGEFLLTQRSAKKKVWPGVWTNSVCGHPAPGESLEHAISRRLGDELGMHHLERLEAVDRHFRYTTPPFNGVIENELCPIFIATTSEEPAPNPDEVEAFRWIDWVSVPDLIAQSPDDFSYWFKLELPIVARFAQLARYTGGING